LENAWLIPSKLIPVILTLIKVPIKEGSVGKKKKFISPGISVPLESH
jgi:hypothetical protein